LELDDGAWLGVMEEKLGDFLLMQVCKKKLVIKDSSSKSSHLALARQVNLYLASPHSFDCLGVVKMIFLFNNELKM